MAIKGFGRVLEGVGGARNIAGSLVASLKGRRGRRLRWKVLVGVAFVMVVAVVGFGLAGALSEGGKVASDVGVGPESPPTAPSSTDLQGYYLYTNGSGSGSGLGLGSAEYIVPPKAIDLHRSEEWFVRYMLEHELFNNNEKTIQSELNRISR